MTVGEQWPRNKQIHGSRYCVSASQTNIFWWKQLNSKRATVFSVRSVSRCYKRDKLGAAVEVGSNTSTVALRVAGGDEKGSLESETVRYGYENHGTRTREWLRWRRPAAIGNRRPVLSSEKAPHVNKPATVWQ
jgi:hypothetical protein